MSHNPEQELLDSDDDDDDFVPGVEEDDEPIPADSEDDEVEAAGTKKRKTPTEKGKSKAKPEKSASQLKKRKGLQLSDEEDDPVPSNAPLNEPEEAIQRAPEKKADAEIDALWAALNGGASPAAAKPQEKKSEVDELWNQLNKPQSQSTSQLRSQTPAKVSGIPASWLTDAPTKPSPPIEQKDTITVERKYDFAGETVVVKEEVKIDPKLRTKQPTSGGLGSLLSDLKGKGKKMSAIQKSAHDWQSFRKEEGLEEELDKQKKDGYLEKQAFLTRTDWRQFELEKAVRDKARAQAQSQQKKN